MTYSDADFFEANRLFIALTNKASTTKDAKLQTNDQTVSKVFRFVSFYLISKEASDGNNSSLV